MGRKTLAMELVTIFNIATNLKLRTGEEKGEPTTHTNKMQALLDMGIPFDTIANYAEDWGKNNPNPNPDRATMMFYGYVTTAYKTKPPVSTAWKNGKRILEPVKTEEVKTAPAPTKTETTAPATSSAEAQAAGILNQMTNLIVNSISEETTRAIANMVKEEAKAEVVQFVHDTYGDIPKKNIIVVDKTVHEVKGVTHEKFKRVCTYIANDRAVMLVGGAGSGKNVLCQQVAEGLGLKFYMSNAVTQEYKITGYSDSGGRYLPTPFYEAWTNGGLFMLDEMDASIAEVLVVLNAALANGYADFPAPIGNVTKHKDFHFIAAANTFGLGADYKYVGRNVIDMATLDRFSKVTIDYSPRIEESVADGDKDLLDFIRKFRRSVAQHGIEQVVSTRTLAVLRKFDPIFEEEGDPLSELIEENLTSSMKLDDLNIIRSDVDLCGKWTFAFNDVIKKRRAEAA